MTHASPEFLANSPFAALEKDLVSFKNAQEEKLQTLEKSYSKTISDMASKVEALTKEQGRPAPNHALTPSSMKKSSPSEYRMAVEDLGHYLTTGQRLYKSGSGSDMQFPAFAMDRSHDYDYSHVAPLWALASKVEGPGTGQGARSLVALKEPFSLKNIYFDAERPDNILPFERIDLLLNVFNYARVLDSTFLSYAPDAIDVVQKNMWIHMMTWQHLTFMQGSGRGMPRGITTCSGARFVDAPALPKDENEITDMVSKVFKHLKGSARTGPMHWIVSPEFALTLRKFHSVPGTHTWTSSIENGRVVDYFCGYPIFTSEQLPDHIYAIFGNFEGAYTIGHSQSVEVHRSLDTASPTLTLRSYVDGRPNDEGQIVFLGVQASHANHLKSIIGDDERGETFVNWRKIPAVKAILK